MAKDLVRTRRQIEKFYKLKSQLQGVSLRIQDSVAFSNYFNKNVVSVSKAEKKGNFSIFLCSNQIHAPIPGTGIALVYDTEDFKNYGLKEDLLHVVPGTGMWECVDFFPVSKKAENGLDTSINGAEVKHVMKVSLDDDRHDYYALGTYDEKKGIPRTVKFDKKTSSNLLQWPVAEVESLRLRSDEFKDLKAKPGSVVSIDIETATQVCVHVVKLNLKT
ncbi:Glycosyl hydrolase family 32, N-terminal [Sesbania bispinosa]|nr:Glycosyl hydrolase family 32, N-terminal [Sesbania bispinosa]